MTKPSPGPGIIRGLTQVRDALRDGESMPERFTVRTVQVILAPREYTAEEVVALREKLRASQGVFAMLLGVSIKTVQAWEQGGNPLPPMARRLLESIDKHPKMWEETLRDAAVPVT